MRAATATHQLMPGVLRVAARPHPIGGASGRVRSHRSAAPSGRPSRSESVCFHSQPFKRGAKGFSMPRSCSVRPGNRPAAPRHPGGVCPTPVPERRAQEPALHPNPPVSRAEPEATPPRSRTAERGKAKREMIGNGRFPIITGTECRSSKPRHEPLIMWVAQPNPPARGSPKVRDVAPANGRFGLRVPSGSPYLGAARPPTS
jgi:hypothetical protein